MMFKSMLVLNDRYGSVKNNFFAAILLALLCIACGDRSADDGDSSDPTEQAPDLSWQDLMNICQEATTQGECEAADKEVIDYRDTFYDWSDVTFSCDWVEFRSTRIEDDVCVFGNSVGKCQSNSYGEFGGDLYPAVCGAAGYSNHQLFLSEIEGETYLSLEYREGYNSSALRCDESSPDYSPYCGCLCQADSPFGDEAVICDQQYPENCDQCVACSYDAQCAFIGGSCYSLDTCGAFNKEFWQLSNARATGSSEWLALYDSYLETFAVEQELDDAEVEALENAYQREFVCKYCSACGGPCTNAKPACERWASLYTD